MKDKKKSGWRMDLVGGRCQGQWLRMPEPFDQEVPMPNGERYILVRNYSGSKYEYTYVEHKTLEAST